MYRGRQCFVTFAVSVCPTANALPIGRIVTIRELFTIPLVDLPGNAFQPYHGETVPGVPVLLGMRRES